MTTTDTSEKTTDVALHLFRAVRALRGHLDGHRLGFTGWSALSTICEHGPLTPGGIATREGVRAPSVSRTVAALAAAGLVSVSKDSTDHRLLVVTATPAGHQACRDPLPADTTELLEALDAADRVALGRLAAAVTDQFHPDTLPEHLPGGRTPATTVPTAGKVRPEK
jgi:DNA-binding MarR family transcriptional regulator